MIRTRRTLRDETGYSLVEVMASIVILTIAIIPMVGMFDMGLNMASRSGNYDKARALANKQLETAKSRSYEDAKNKFPVASSAPSGGTYTSPNLTAPADAGLPTGSTYKIEKQYVLSPGNTATVTDSATDEGVMQITVTVNWNDTSYTTSTLKASAA